MTTLACGDRCRVGSRIGTITEHDTIRWRFTVRLDETPTREAATIVIRSGSNLIQPLPAEPAAVLSFCI
jgi:hypothetical protein